MTVAQSNRKRCPVCQGMFTPDPRVGARQHFCSKATCQRRRQRDNETCWRRRNRECASTQQRKWRQKNPEYLRVWRDRHPKAVERNRTLTRRRMRARRDRVMFEKSKEMRMQLVGREGYVYFSRGRGWLIARLKRASPWSKVWVRRYALRRITAKNIRLPRGRLYAVPGPD